MRLFPVVAFAVVVAVVFFALTGLFPAITAIVKAILGAIGNGIKFVAKKGADLVGDLFPWLLLAVIGGFLGLLVWPFLGVAAGVWAGVIGAAAMVGTGVATGLVGGDSAAPSAGASGSGGGTGKKAQSIDKVPTGFTECTNVTLEGGIRAKVCRNPVNQKTVWWDPANKVWAPL